MNRKDLKLPALLKLRRQPQLVAMYHGSIRDALVHVSKGRGYGSYGICHSVRRYLFAGSEYDGEYNYKVDAFNVVMSYVADHLGLAAYWFTPGKCATSKEQLARVEMAGLLVQMLDNPNTSVPIPDAVSALLQFTDDEDYDDE